MANRLKLFQIAACVAVVTMGLSASSVVETAAAPLRVTPAAQARCSAGPVDPAELETFLDSIIEPQLQDAHVAGVTLSVVRGGKVFLTKGYGYADVARSIPVHPESTLFQIGSVTKLFTWTAVMQLVEQGKLDLDADVNTYLDFKIPATYPKPITLKHLMSHSAGFEDISLGLFPSRFELIQPLGPWLAGHIPTRVRPPGVISAYSNYGAELAGYLVERVSGLAYEEYIEKNLFQPLDMRHTTVRQPLPANFAPDMSVGYTYVNGAWQAQALQFHRTLPAGAISATAMDMAHFMIAHLEDGRYGAARILQEQTAQQMRRTLFRLDDRVNGFTYGFWERDMNGQRVIGHSGGTRIFESDLILLPDQDFGLYISYNTSGAETSIDQLILAFMDHYYPPEQEAQEPPAFSDPRAVALTGSYRLTRSSYTTFEKVKGLVLYLDVSAEPDGTLVLSPTQIRLVPVAPRLFRDDTYGLPVVFRQDAGDPTTYLLIANRPDQTFEKVAWYEAPSFHYALLLFCAILFLSVPLAAVVGRLVDRFRRTDRGPAPAPPRIARLLLALIAALNLLGLADFILVFDNAYLAVARGDVSSLYLPLLLWLSAAVLTIGTLGFTALGWKNRYWGVMGRVHYALVTLAAVVFIWILNFWNLLVWRM